jgi:hypothetical protein
VSHAHLSLRAGPQARLPAFRRSRAQDYLAFACASRSELEEWERHLNKLGIPKGGIVEAPYGSGLSFRDLEAASGSAEQIPVQRFPGAGTVSPR